jgi:plasmid maintenance system killer protein
MIKGFRHKGLKRLFENNETQGIPAGQSQKLLDVLGACRT